VTPTIYPVDEAGPGALSTMAKPRAGDWIDDEMNGLADLGVDVVVSLLTDAEVAELDLEREDAAARSAGLTFLRLPIADRGLPERDALESLVSALVAARGRGEHVVIHCRFGIGRSSLVAAAVLVAEGVDPDDAWRLIGDARGRAVPDTPEQRAFVAVGAQ
jgi:protein-tyrosine phosphatase